MNIDSTSPCEVQTFLYGRDICPLTLSNHNSSTFYTYGNTTYYSVSHPIDVVINCPDENNQNWIIDGTGSLTTSASCNIRVGDFITIRHEFTARTSRLSDILFPVLTAFDTSLNHFPLPTLAPSVITFKPPETKLLEANSLHEALDILFDPNQTAIQALWSLIYFICFILCFLILYTTWEWFRLWFNDCCSCSKPQKYWNRYYEHVPQYVRRTTQHVKNSNVHERFQKNMSKLFGRAQAPSQDTQFYSGPDLAKQAYPDLV